MAALFAHLLFAAAFPGGPVRCDEGGGVVRMEPAHGPHAPSCCPAPIEASTLELDHRDHDHGGCVDAEAEAAGAPAKAFKMKPPSAAPVAFAEAALPGVHTAGPAAAPRSLSPPLAEHISTTVIRS